MEEWQVVLLLSVATVVIGAVTAWITTWSQRRKVDSEAAEKLTDAAIALIEPYKSSLLEALAQAGRFKTELEGTLDKSRAFTARIEHLESELESTRSELALMRLENEHLQRELDELRTNNRRLQDQLSKATCSVPDCDKRKPL